MRGRVCAPWRGPCTVPPRRSAGSGGGIPHRWMPPGRSSYDAKLAGQEARRCRFKPRRSPKLAVDGVLLGVVEPFLPEGWSPGQIAGALKMMWPDAPERRVSTETSYTGRYALPRGALRQELIACLRQAHRARLPRSRGTDWRGQLTDMVSIHVRPPAVEDRALPGHWEGDFLKGAGNRSAVGVLVERSSRLVLLAKMDDATAALTGYTRKLNGIAAPMRPSLTYDQGNIAPGNGGPARTPTVSCASTSPRARTCPSTARNSSMRSRSVSTSGHAQSMATSRPSVSIGPCWNVSTSPMGLFTNRCCTWY